MKSETKPKQSFGCVQGKRRSCEGLWCSSGRGTCFLFILLLTWFNCHQQVWSLFQQSSMEARKCSNFRSEEFPQITVRHGEHSFNRSFANKTPIDHEMFFFKCIAPYPIEWISNDPSVYSMDAPKSILSHLHIYRTFSNISDLSTYRFVISTKVRFKRSTGLKHLNETCRSIVKPFCLSVSIVSGNESQDAVGMDISMNPVHLRRDVLLSEVSEEGVGADLGNITSIKDVCDYTVYYTEQTSGSRLSFTCLQDGQPTSLQFIHQCNNAMTCLNLFRNKRLPFRCAQKAMRNLTCDQCGNSKLSQGVIKCDSTHGNVDTASTRFLFFFTSIAQGKSSKKLYFRMKDVNASEMMRLSEIPHQVYIGDQLTVTCNVSNYYFAGGTRLALKYKDSDQLKFFNTGASKSLEGMEHFAGSVIEVNIPISSVRLEAVYCFAPVWNSFDWGIQSQLINVKEIISQDIIIAVSIAIFLTALFVAMMFAILWVKVGKKHGRLNLLTSSEIEEFRKINIADETKPIKSPSNNECNEITYGTTAAYDPTYEIKRDRLLLDETVVLGHGHFGLVLKGIVKDSRNDVRIDVAVKTLKTKVDIGSLKALLSELKILASVGKHCNVVNLVGACTKKMSKGEVYVAVEYCANGNLQNFLRHRRQTFRNQLENDVLVIETPIRKLSASSECIMTIDLIRWAWETAKGMEFLGSKKVIHGDLATRNILINSDHVAKVSDFGLSRQLVDYYYVQKETGPMPWKWMALESLRDMKFSVQSDIWSFGVTLWELFTLADVPYSGCSWSAEFVETLALGHRLGKPKFATSEMYDLMRECWKTEPSSRPSFLAIKMFFEDILTQCTSQDYVQINNAISGSGTLTTDDEYQCQPLLQSPRIIIEEEGEDDVFE